MFYEKIEEIKRIFNKIQIEDVLVITFADNKTPLFFKAESKSVKFKVLSYLQSS